ncbi:MAG: AAA family ATPase [Bacteroidales bacterium]|nr:AAA family ATPase [Bacteroidales bacterium]
MNFKNLEKRMSIKIKKIAIKGIRGVQKTMELQLSEKSILIYGDNGTGKSSISDSFEWFFNDKVRHLSEDSEIDFKDALRNSNIEDTEVSSVEMIFSEADVNSTKTLNYKKNKLVSDFSNKSDDFNSYLNNTQNENLVLRYQFLTEFIDKTKGEKLKSLSDVIGYAEVNKAKEVLKTAYNSIKTEIKNQNYESQINTQKQIQIEKIGAAIGVEKNLFEKVNEIITPLKLGVAVKSFKDIDAVLNLLKTRVNTIVLDELRFLENCKNTLTNLKGEISLLNSEYEKYYIEFNKIADDVYSIMQIFFAELLKAGRSVIEKKYHLDDTCPLCLQPMSKYKLLKDIQKRLAQIEESLKKKTACDAARQSIINISKERINRLENLRIDSHYNNKAFEPIKKAIDYLIIKISSLEKEANEKFTSGNKISEPKTLKLQDADFAIFTILESKITALQAVMKKDNNAVIYSNISSAKDAFLRIKKFEKERKVFEDQRSSMEIIYNEFVKKLKEGLENFITTFSGTINEYYQFMNPGEQFQELKIVTIGEEDELNGITIEYKYNDNWVSPPQKYFSESHLNCFGLSFFLASVIAFNKENKFLLLDDVISSFDSNHRKKFADLIFEKFSDYQIILMTHENEWYQYVSQLAKRKSWLINEIKWSDTEGTYIEDKPTDLREIIETNIAKGDIDITGNPIRKYLEHTLKVICANLEVKVNFRFNEVNEKRMPDELLNDLKSKINKSSNDLKSKMPIIDRIINSNILGNLLSHDNPFSPKLGDLKAFWADLGEFEKLFYCQESTCKKPMVSMRNYDTVAKKIRCGCDKTKYDWKI